MTILLVDSDKRALDREAQRLSRRQSGIVVVLHSSAADAESLPCTTMWTLCTSGKSWMR